MMRFKKGCKIEVFKKWTPLGSWWPAEIISGNGHTYFVRYYRCSGDMGANVEKVPRKAIRPCPPLEGLKSWVEGDIVEVFNDGSWKIAHVSRIIGGYHYFVRLLGSSTGFRANLCDIRVRQTWQDNNWMVILKDSSKFSDRMTGKLLNEEGKLIRRNAQLCKEDNNRLDVGPWTSGTKKRPRVLSVAGETRAGRKFRTIEEGGGYHQQLAGSSKLLHEKVDAVVSPRKLLGENYMHASVNDRTGFSETHRGEGIRNADNSPYYRSWLERHDSESFSSSVGSCSASNSPYRTPYCLDGSTQNIGCCSDDCESSSSGRELSFPSKEALAEKIHQLELNAYKSTLVALYASGPISWDQEAMMTNLRLMLHISNDEHLLEIKKIISAERYVPFR